MQPPTKLLASQKQAKIPFARKNNGNFMARLKLIRESNLAQNGAEWARSIVRACRAHLFQHRIRISIDFTEWTTWSNRSKISEKFTKTNNWDGTPPDPASIVTSMPYPDKFWTRIKNPEVRFSSRLWRSIREHDVGFGCEEFQSRLRRGSPKVWINEVNVVLK